MPSPPPPDDGVMRAVELWGDNLPLRQIAQTLCNEGYQCKSHETARSWIALGRQALALKELIGREETRERLVLGLQQDMARVRRRLDKAVDDYQPTMKNLQWMYELTIKLTGAEALSEDARALAASVDPVTAQAVRLATEGKTPEAAIRRQRSERNGSKP